jgi:PAS domain S-box-containing protein
MLYDREGKHIYMNPAGMASADFTEADIIGKTHREANYGASGSENRKSDIEAVFRTGKASSRLVKWEKVKGTVYLDWRLSPVPGPDGDIELVLGISRDITALKTAEHELKKKEELFRALIENAPDGVVLVDREGRFVYISPSARSLLGYSLDEALTFSPDEGTHPEDLPSVLAALDQIIRDPSAVAVREYRFRQKSGG